MYLLGIKHANGHLPKKAIEYCRRPRRGAKRREVPAITHVDGTARVQTVGARRARSTTA